ncbi:SDR family NAD(P)-dependent oxidoreductase [Pyxidicoccus sp. MSG2]|uniref:SDR family NAD(P)-dependent oxidoreductase n=1 Tax=Pyxidicoccus sp. MSG2 TaxID=2996790 RepID=UPI00226F0FB6|nr:SDR family NAD(P)-dependent oxidoreductase [Pyxidicoccus sp. MSG2]MCY1023584.1 SDR family NAD(P)-dependent oxidoreductase [Pyxidicoccus sp. MSG2]
MSTHSIPASSKVWFVTGASSGFGRAVVEEALRRGDRVVATARRPEALADLAARAPEERLHLAELDVTRPEQVRAAVAAAVSRFGRIDVLVNNAGFSILGAVEETGDDALRATMELMFFAAAATTREVLPHMRARASGTIVQMTSVAGISTAPGFGAYCAAKHALEALSECLAQEVKPLGIRVLVVEPGTFRTALFGPAFRTMPAMDAYAATVGQMRSWVTQMDGEQAGDPAKAARAIAEVVARPADELPLRLPLGGDAVDQIRGKLAFIAADVDRTEAIARATAFDAKP